MLTCQRVLHAYVLTCQRTLRICVLTCSRAYVPCVPKCSRAITSINKCKVSMTCFTLIFGTFSLSFSWEIKLYMKSIYDKQECLWKHLLWEFNSTFRHFPYQAEAFNKWQTLYNKMALCNNFCLGRTSNELFLIFN